MENGLVVKNNNLIEARYDLGLNEQKIILYAVNKLDRDKKKFNILSLNIRDFFELIGTTQERYSEIRETVRGLRKKEIIINTKERELIVGWLSSIDYLKDEGTIELEFSEKLAPYLLQLKERFTRYEIENILYLKNKHSIRIYELMKQYEKIGKREFELEQFKYLLMIDGQYERVYDLERFVLEVAQKEINKFTDLNITYEKLKKGRKVTGLLFEIESKNKEKQVYIEYLNGTYNIKEMKSKMGLSNEKFSAEQILNLYELSIEKTQDEFNPFEYCRLNYLHVKNLKQVRNVYAYLCDSIAKDYAAAMGQLSILDRNINQY